MRESKENVKNFNGHGFSGITGCDGERAVLWQMAVTIKLPLGAVNLVCSKIGALQGRMVGMMEPPWLAGSEDGAQEAPSRGARVILSSWVPTGTGNGRRDPGHGRH